MARLARWRHPPRRDVGVRGLGDALVGGRERGERWLHVSLAVDGEDVGLELAGLELHDVARAQQRVVLPAPAPPRRCRAGRPRCGRPRWQAPQCRNGGPAAGSASGCQWPQ